MVLNKSSHVCCCLKEGDFFPSKCTLATCNLLPSIEHRERGHTGANAIDVQYFKSRCPVIHKPDFVTLAPWTQQFPSTSRLFRTQMERLTDSKGERHLSPRVYIMHCRVHSLFARNWPSNKHLFKQTHKVTETKMKESPRERERERGNLLCNLTCDSIFILDICIFSRIQN